VHVGSSTPALAFGAQYAQRIEEGEAGNNTPASPRLLTDSTGTLSSGYAIVRPIVALTAAKSHPLSLVARWDRVTSNTDTDDAWDFFVAGAIWDLNAKASVSVDYQEASSARGQPMPLSRTWYFHIVARY
jgi:hypothetical protein